MQHRITFTRRHALALGALGVLAVPGGAWAAGATVSGQPPALSGPVSGQLAANSGGSFALYQFAYPGNGAAVTLTLTANTATPLRSGAAGINVYQNGARVVTSSLSGPFTATAVFSSSTGGTIYVQVFNYDPANAVGYTLTAQGLPTSTTSAVASTSSATAASSSVAATSATSTVVSAAAAGRPTSLTGPVSGRLAGASSGSFALYQFTQTGTGATITFVLTADNQTPMNSGAAGLNVYQNGNLLATSSQSGPGQRTATIAPTVGGVIVVQVFNYDPANPINYTLTPQNLPAQPFVSTPASSTTATATVRQASSTATSAAPVAFTGQAKGILAGLHGGAFALYAVAYAGNSQPVTLTLNVFPAAEVMGGAAGFNIYDASGNVTTAKPTGTTGAVAAQILNAKSGTYTVQVFNYDSQTAITYTLTQS